MVYDIIQQGKEIMEEDEELEDDFDDDDDEFEPSAESEWFWSSSP
jgi:hypothetical protein